MKEFVARKGVKNAPYQEVKAFRFYPGKKKVAGIDIIDVHTKDKNGEDVYSYSYFMGNRGGAHGKEILNNGDRIVKASADTFAIERKPFKQMYTPKLRQLKGSGSNE